MGGGTNGEEEVGVEGWGSRIEGGGWNWRVKGGIGGVEGGVWRVEGGIGG